MQLNEKVNDLEVPHLMLSLTDDVGLARFPAYRTGKTIPSGNITVREIIQV